MKHHVLPRELAKFGGRLLLSSRKLNFLTDTVLQAQLKTVQTLQSQYAQDLAVGPSAHLLDIVISCLSGKQGFQANYVRSKRETSAL